MGVFGRYIQLVRVFWFVPDGAVNVAGLFAFDGPRRHDPVSGVVAPRATGDHNDWHYAVDFSAMGRNTYARAEGPAGFIELDLGADVHITRLVVWNRNDTQQAALRLVGCRLCVLGADGAEVFAYTFYTGDAYFDLDLSHARASGMHDPGGGV
jgi:hypothetical protein